VKKLDILENQAKVIYLGLGSNLGNKKKNLEKAKFLLNLNGIKIIKTSSYYETKSWPNRKFPKYLNIVIKGSTLLKPTILFNVIKYIEKKLGRKKTKKNHPRTCDIDILDYDNKNISINIDNECIVIPHPRLHKRNFVLFPLFEISKDWLYPRNKLKISQLLSNISNNDLRSIKII